MHPNLKVGHSTFHYSDVTHSIPGRLGINNNGYMFILNILRYVKLNQ